MWPWVVCCLLAAGIGDVQVKPLRGAAIAGTLVALSEREVRVTTPAGEQQWSSSNLQVVEFASSSPDRPPSDPNAVPPVAAAVTVELLDGSVLKGNRWTQDGVAGKLDGPPALGTTVPTKLVRAVRLRAATSETAQPWSAIVEQAAAGDQLVVRKMSEPEGDDRPPKLALDPLEGVIHSVSDTHVQFELDGEKLAVPLAKLEGIVLRNRPPSAFPDAMAKVVDRLGGVWAVRTLTWKDGAVQFETVGGLRSELPAAHLREIDFTAGNLVYLSDLTPESVDWRPYVQTAATPPLLAKWFQLRADHLADGGPLTLNGESFEKGLLAHSRTEVSYRLTTSFRRFQAVAGIDDRFRGTGGVQLVITGDDRVLLSESISSSSEPRAIDLDVQGVRRLKLLIDFGPDKSDAGDHLILGNARLTK